MRQRRPIPALALAAVAAVATTLLAGPAGAAPTPQLTDRRGDTPVASADILSATLSTARDGSGPHLRVELVLAGPLDDALPYTRGVTFTIGGCAFAAVQYTHGSGTAPTSDVGCSTGASRGLRGRMQVHGSKLLFRAPLDGKDLRVGARVRSLAAFTHPSGVIALHTPLTLAGDVAEGRDWVVTKPRR